MAPGKAKLNTVFSLQHLSKSPLQKAELMVLAVEGPPSGVLRKTAVWTRGRTTQEMQMRLFEGAKDYFLTGETETSRENVAVELSPKWQMGFWIGVLKGKEKSPQNKIKEQETGASYVRDQM